MGSSILIGVSGGSGSGKTSLLRRIQAAIGSEHLAIVSQDDYYHPIHLQKRTADGELNFDLPTAIDEAGLLRDIDQLKSGCSVEIQRYGFNNKERSPENIRIDPKPVILVEGLFVFHYPFLRERLDMMVFVDACPLKRLDRRLKRDKDERGYDADIVHHQWKYHVEPAERDYLLPHVENCDIIVKNDQDMEEGFNELIERIHGMIHSVPVQEE